jgi:hypothetical protein
MKIPGPKMGLTFVHRGSLHHVVESKRLPAVYTTKRQRVFHPQPPKIDLSNQAKRAQAILTVPSNTPTTPP